MTKVRLLRLLFGALCFVSTSNLVFLTILEGFRPHHSIPLSLTLNGNNAGRNGPSASTCRKLRQTSRTPLIIVPGSMGSLIEARLEKKKVTASIFCSSSWNSWYTLWISEWALTFPSCFFDNIEMKYSGNGKVENADGVITRVKDYGSSVEGIRCILAHTKATCEATRNWEDVIRMLESIGYRVGKDLFSAPYDFRRGPDDYMDDDFPKLKQLVENAYEINGQRPVALMSISLGSVFLHTFFTHFVDQSWKDKYIKRWLSMSGLFNGFSQSFQNAFFGRNTFMTMRGFKATDVRNAYRTWFSAIWLIPRDTYGDNRVILKTRNQSYTLSDVKDIIYGDQAEIYSRSLLYNASADPGVPTDCWFSTGKRTAVAYKIQADYMTKELFYSDSPVVVEKEIMGSGDGAGDLKSLQVCERWKSTTVRRFSICHGCFLYAGISLKAIGELLTTPSLGC